MTDLLRTTDDYFDEALGCLDAGDYERAIPLLARIVAFDPADHEAHGIWIDAHMRAGRYRRVIQIADEGIAQGRPRLPLLVWKSLAHAALEDLPEAERVVRKALEEEPDADSAAFMLSALLENQGRAEEALDLVRRFDASYPGREDVVRRVIDLANHLDQHAVVIDSARDYLRRFGKDASVLYKLGFAYLGEEDHRKAERAFRDAVATDPDNAGYHVSLLMLNLLRGKEEEVQRHLESLEDRDPDLACVVSEEVDRLLEQLEADQMQDR